jgi:hypothetical protein
VPGDLGQDAVAEFVFALAVSRVVVRVGAAATASTSAYSWRSGARTARARTASRHLSASSRTSTRARVAALESQQPGPDEHARLGPYQGHRRRPRQFCKPLSRRDARQHGTRRANRRMLDPGAASTPLRRLDIGRDDSPLLS